ncbi:MAG: TM2 domain-containing protein [Acidimicrobiales bacterium]|nr:TM2 domain-containing protein [Acidimicrobiales bacterium]MCB9373071.1 TM2 domain-containing protein [Microthrixaceae bacterium]
MSDAPPPPPGPDPSSTPPPAPGTPPPPAAAYQPPAAGYQQPVGGQVPAVGPDGTPLKSKMVAGLLGIFLGGFGVHNFYLGNTNKGIIQIVVTLVTCGIGAIWGTIEGILILVGNQGFSTDAQGRPLTD